MISFIMALIALILGYCIYGRIVERVAGPTDNPTPAIEATLDGINPLNAGKKKEEALSMLKKWFPQMENFSGQLKKYKVTINDLLAENEFFDFGNLQRFQFEDDRAGD